MVECETFAAGPSFAVDTACSASLLALDHALRAIRTDQCEAAIVGGTSLCLHPSTTAQFTKLGMLSPHGACKSFDASGLPPQFSVVNYCRSATGFWFYVLACRFRSTAIVEVCGQVLVC